VARFERDHMCVDLWLLDSRLSEGLSTRGREFPDLRRGLYTLFLPGHELPSSRHPSAKRS
jgi:hypothetical protein